MLVRNFNVRIYNRTVTYDFRNITSACGINGVIEDEIRS